MDGTTRDSQHMRDFIHLQPVEDAELGNPGHTLFHICKSLECRIEVEDTQLGFIMRQSDIIVQSGPVPAATAPGRQLGQNCLKSMRPGRNRGAREIQYRTESVVRHHFINVILNVAT